MHRSLARAQVLYRGLPNYGISGFSLSSMKRSALLAYVKNNDIEIDEDGMDVKTLIEIAKSIWPEEIHVEEELSEEEIDEKELGEEEELGEEDEEEVHQASKRRKTVDKSLEELARESVVADFANKEPGALKSMLTKYTMQKVCGSYKLRCSPQHLMRMLFCCLTNNDLGIKHALVCLQLHDEVELEDWLQTPIVTYNTLLEQPDLVFHASQIVQDDFKAFQANKFEYGTNPGYHEMLQLCSHSTNHQLLDELKCKYLEYAGTSNFMEALIMDAQAAFRDDQDDDHNSAYVYFLSQYYNETRDR